MRTVKYNLKTLLIVFIIWIVTVSIIQRIKCDKLTETQLLKDIPMNSILRFEKCK